MRVSGTEPDPAVVALAVELLSAGSLSSTRRTRSTRWGRVLDAAAGRPCAGPGTEEEAAAGGGGRSGRRAPLRRLAEAADLLAARFWPGLTLLAVPAVPGDVTAGSGNIAVRVPDLELTRALCRRAGPLVSTSANRAGGTPPITCADALEAVGAGAALALDAGRGRAIASTIVDLTSTPPRLVRGGAISWEEIEGVLRPSAG